MAAGLVVLLLAGVLLSGCGQETTSTAEPSSGSPTVTPTATHDAVATVIAMQEAATEVPTITPAPSATATPAPTLTPTSTPTTASTVNPTPSASLSLTPTETASPVMAYPTNTPRATQIMLEPVASAPTVAPYYTLVGDEIAVPEHYWLARPFPRDPSGQIVDYFSRTYPYGSTASGQFQVHHGADFPNVYGTRVLAAASGWVVYAGDDLTDIYGKERNFYGNLVILEHEFPGPNGLAVYTLYGHLSQVDVETGQRVDQGERIGQVGAEGVALGSHLHLEVRLGDPFDYGSTVNPDLWLRPWVGFGTVAGRLTDATGRSLHDVTVTFQSPGAPDRYTTTYADDTVNSDPLLGENFVRGDLPEGGYEVFVRHNGVVRFRGSVTVEGGKTSWLDIQLK